MARMARVVIPGIPHHVTQRGNRRQPTFFSDADYAVYRSLLARYCARERTEVWAYCLMPNHVHLIMVPSHRDGLRASLAGAHRHYTTRVNEREGWRGHLWQERFYSFPMDEEHLWSAVHYVELNPVAAGLCAKPEAWPWSSARAHLEGRDDGLVTVRPMLGRVPDWAGYLSIRTTREEAEQIRRHGRTGRPLGSDAFKAQLELLTGRTLRARKPGPKPTQTSVIP